MVINKVKLINFRNYDNIEIDLTAGINAFVGENGSGKTNIIEALYFMSMAKSFRTSNDAVLVKSNSDKMFIALDISYEGIQKTITCEYVKSQHKKIFRHNNNRLNKISDLIGHIPVIIFTPESLQIIKLDPQLRRNFIDEFICQIDKTYYETLLKYNKIISHRNFILKKIKEGAQKKETIDIWNKQMIDAGSEIIFKRYIIIDEINKHIMENPYGYEKNISISYSSRYFSGKDIDKIKKIYNKFLPEIFNEEINRGITLIGPHRDDLEIIYDNKIAKLYASEGQQRMIMLLLKFIQSVILREKLSVNPVILLDDFSSELDAKNLVIVCNLFDFNKQILITTTSIQHVPVHYINKKFSIENGEIKTI